MYNENLQPPEASGPSDDEYYAYHETELIEREREKRLPETSTIISPLVARTIDLLNKRIALEGTDFLNDLIVKEIINLYGISYNNDKNILEKLQ